MGLFTPSVIHGWIQLLLQSLDTTPPPQPNGGNAAAAFQKEIENKLWFQKYYYGAIDNPTLCTLLPAMKSDHLGQAVIRKPYGCLADNLYCITYVRSVQSDCSEGSQHLISKATLLSDVVLNFKIYDRNFVANTTKPVDEMSAAAAVADNTVMAAICAQSTKLGHIFFVSSPELNSLLLLSVSHKSDYDALVKLMASSSSSSSSNSSSSNKANKGENDYSIWSDLMDMLTFLKFIHPLGLIFSKDVNCQVKPNPVGVGVSVTIPIGESKSDPVERGKEYVGKVVHTYTSSVDSPVHSGKKEVNFESVNDKDVDEVSTRLRASTSSSEGDNRYTPLSPSDQLLWAEQERIVLIYELQGALDEFFQGKTDTLNHKKIIPGDTQSIYSLERFIVALEKVVSHGYDTSSNLARGSYDASLVSEKSTTTFSKSLTRLLKPEEHSKKCCDVHKASSQMMHETTWLWNIGVQYTALTMQKSFMHMPSFCACSSAEIEVEERFQIAYKELESFGVLYAATSYLKKKEQLTLSSRRDSSRINSVASMHDSSAASVPIELDIREVNSNVLRVLLFDWLKSGSLYLRLNNLLGHLLSEEIPKFDSAITPSGFWSDHSILKSPQERSKLMSILQTLDGKIITVQQGVGHLNDTGTSSSLLSGISLFSARPSDKGGRRASTEAPTYVTEEGVSEVKTSTLGGCFR